MFRAIQNVFKSMKQNARTFICGSLSSLGEQQLIFMFSKLSAKSRKVKLGILVSYAWFQCLQQLPVLVTPSNACHVSSQGMLE
jgi:hypothetical protein